jgi:hypothetical protein
LRRLSPARILVRQRMPTSAAAWRIHLFETLL